MLARPLAGWSVVAAFALIGLAVLGTAWSTRSTLVDATDAVRSGETLTAEQAIRADLADLDGPATAADLADILQDHAEAGVRYVAVLDKRQNVLAEAGTPAVDAGPRENGNPRRVTMHHGRVRVEYRLNQRRARREGARTGSQWVAIEIEPIEAQHVRNAADRTVYIGTIAALTLLGVAGFLVRSELRRQAAERVRERERRLASLGEMSAVLAHEIKNPLASLKGNAQLLASMLPAGEKPKAKAERVVEEALRLERLTVDLLAFVRTGELAKAASDPASLVRDAVGEKDQVTVDVSGAPKSWSLDAARIRQVVVNLVDNALQAGPPVTVTVRQAQGELQIDVGDCGPGVPDDKRDKIFEPFFTGKSGGTGLGLAVSQRIVDAHGGRITVERASSGGALFRVAIPA